MRVRELQVRSSRARELEHRARLQSFADRGRVHPEQRPRPIAMFDAPVSIAATNAATSRERSKKLRFAIRGDSCRAARQMGERAIAELDGDTHSGLLGCW